MAGERVFRAGYGVREITPRSGTPFGGFAIERTTGATAVHDPLSVTALVVDDGISCLALVSSDLQLIAPWVVDAARSRIAATSPVRFEAVMVHATHVHSAPGGDAAEAAIPGLDTFFSTPGVEQAVALGVAGAVMDAVADLAPAELGTVTGEVAGIGASRHKPGGGPQFAGVARLAFARGRAPIVVVNHGCHASVLGPDNTAVSADYPGVLRRLAVARGERLLFLNGPAGDISTRATPREQTFAEVERLGGLLDAQLIGLQDTVWERDPSPLGSANAAVRVPVRTIDHEALDRAAEMAAAELAAVSPAEWAQADQALRRAQFRRDRLRRLTARTLDVELQLFAIGELAVLGVGGELFSQPGAAIRAGSPFETTFVAAPVNGSVGNIPDADLAGEGGGMLAEGAVEAIVATAIGLLQQLRERRADAAR